MLLAVCTVLILVVTSFANANAIEKHPLISEYNIYNQCRAQNEGFFTIEGYWVYGINFNNKNAMTKIHIEGGENYKLSKYQATHYAFLDEWIFYKKPGDKSDYIYKMRTSGKDQEIFLKFKSTYHFVYGDRLYYTKDNENFALFSCDVNGKNVKKIVESGCYYPVIIYDDTLAYQYDNGKTGFLTTIDLLTGEKNTLSEVTCAKPIYDGEYIYYLGGSKYYANDNVENLSIFRTNGETTEKIVSGGVSIATLWIYDDYIFYANANDDGRLYRVSKDSKGKDKMQISEAKYCKIEFINNDSIYYASFPNFYGTSKMNLYSSTINGGNQKKWKPFN